MAKVKFSALVSGMRNKLNGSVFSVNAYGAYLRNKTSPTNPRSDYQQAQRQMLGSLSASWRGLTQDQRNGWIAATSAFLRTDAFGDQQSLQGNTLFIALNKNLLNAGESQIDAAPSPVEIPSIAISNLAVDAGAGTFTFDIDPGTLPDDTALFVKATAGISPGKQYVQNLLRWIGTETPTTGSVDFSSDYTARFGTPAEGERVSIEVYLVSTVTGQAGVPVSATTIVTSA